ncbi:MAG: tetratricopeptide repeat protein [Anaerolineae bacterium]
MTYTHEEIQDLIDRLFERAKEESADQARMFELVQAAWSLKSWLEQQDGAPVPQEQVEKARALLSEGAPREREPQGLPEHEPSAEGELPLPIPGLTGESQAKDPAEGAQEALVSVTEGLATSEDLPPEAPQERDLNQALQDARAKAQAGDYEGAIALFGMVIEETKDPYLKGRAEKSLQDALVERERRLQALVEEARRAEKEEPQNLDRQRKAWEAVLRLRPDHAGAGEALRQLEKRERLQKQERAVRALRQPIQSRRKDVREVENAIQEAERLKESGEISDPRLRRELEQTLNELQELRNDILRQSEGGASNERAGQYEEAIEKYRATLARGFLVIYDDTTGEPMDVVAALERTRKAYYQDLLGRASRRHRDAMDSLKEGYPEVAIQRLEEAQDLLRKVEEGGDEARRQVDDALARAREEKKRKDQAVQWVTEAESLPDKPEQAWERLVKAREVYPSYPGIGEKIEQAEVRLAEVLARDAGVDLSRARGAMHRRDYGSAREECNSALRRGANLSRPTENLKRRWDEARALLEEIDREEKAYAALKQKMDLIRAALKDQNVRRAKELLDRLSEEEQRDPEVQALRLEWTSLVGDDERYDQAIQFFYEREYRRVIEVCDSLRGSSAYAQKAATLRFRAQARLRMQDARAAREGGQLDTALRFYEQVAEVECHLPEEDLPLVREAKKAAGEVQEELKQMGAFQSRLKEVRALREKEPPQWEKWWEALEGVRKESLPAPLRAHVEVEEEAKQGTALWCEQAEKEARRARQEGLLREAYQVLKPLADRRIISPEHREWRRVQFEYHRQVAERLLESLEEKDWEQAVKEARQALDAASEDRGEEARGLWHKTLKQVCLKRAERAAISAYPQGAVEILEEHFSQYPFLREDPEVCRAMIRYALAAGDFHRALQQAEAMDFVSGQKGTGTWWKMLVQAVQTYKEGRKHEAVDLLMDLEGRGRDALQRSPLLKEEVEEQKGRVLDLLWQEVSLSPSGSAEDQVARQALCLHLISKLQGGRDPEVEKRLRALKDRLQATVYSLAKKAEKAEKVKEFAPARSLRDALAEARELLAQMEAVREAVKVVPGEGEWNDLLTQYEKGLKTRAQRWEKAAGILQEIEETWRKAVQGTWEYAKLQELLDQLLETLGGEETDEVEEWRKRIKNLADIVKELNPKIGKIEDLWNGEEFEELSRLLGEISAGVTQGKKGLGEEFALPTRKVRLSDPYKGDTLEGIDAVRERVNQKRQNLEDWRTWKEQFDQFFESAQACWRQVQEWLGASPPCLSKSKEKLEDLLRLCEKLDHLAEKQPPEVLSDGAQNEKGDWSPEKIFSFTKWLRQRIGEEMEKVEKGLARAEEPLERIRKFVRRGVPLSKEKNRRTLEGLLDDLRQVDSCHPALEEYRELLNRFRGQPKR